MSTKRKTHSTFQVRWYVFVDNSSLLFVSNYCLQNADSSDDEAPPSRAIKQKPEPSNTEELDASNLIASEEATKKFERAEKRRRVYPFSLRPFSLLRAYNTVRAKTQYAYPSSPEFPSSPNEAAGSRPVSLSQRLRALQHELLSLESELHD